MSTSSLPARRCHDQCSYGSISRIRSTVSTCLEPSRTLRTVAIAFQRAPGAKPRRSGTTPVSPGHQSVRWYGSARNAHTSVRGASSSSDALLTQRRQELCAAEHPLELVAALGVVEGTNLRMRGVAGDLLDAEMAVGDGGDLRQVGDRHD